MSTSGLVALPLCSEIVHKTLSPTVAEVKWDKLGDCLDVLQVVEQHRQNNVRIASTLLQNAGSSPENSVQQLPEARWKALRLIPKHAARERTKYWLLAMTLRTHHVYHVLDDENGTASDVATAKQLAARYYEDLESSFLSHLSAEESSQVQLWLRRITADIKGMQQYLAFKEKGRRASGGRIPQRPETLTTYHQWTFSNFYAAAVKFLKATIADRAVLDDTKELLLLAASQPSKLVLPSESQRNVVKVCLMLPYIFLGSNLM